MAVFYVIPCNSQPSIDELTSEIEEYQNIISLYQTKIDSLQEIIQKIKAEEYREITSQGIPFQARVIISMFPFVFFKALQYFNIASRKLFCWSLSSFDGP